MKQVFHPNVTVCGVEGKAEHRGADQDEQHKRGQLGSIFQSLLEDGHAQTALACSQNQGAQSTHGSALGWCGYTQKNRAQHQKDENQRRHQHKSHLFCQLGEQAHLGHAIEDRQCQPKKRGQGQGQNHNFVSR